MYAIIKTGGKQYRVKLGDFIDVELLDSDAGAQIEFSEVLFVFDGANSLVGSPIVDSFPVMGEVIGMVHGEKITSLKYKRSHNQCRKWGHRQKYTRVKITAIGKNKKDERHGT